VLIITAIVPGRLQPIPGENAGDVFGRKIQFIGSIAASFELLGRKVGHFFSKPLGANRVETPRSRTLRGRGGNEAGRENRNEESGPFDRGVIGPKHYEHRSLLVNPVPNARPPREYRLF